MNLVDKHRQIISLIRERSPYDERETERIINKFFARPQRIVRLLVGKHNFDDKKTLDIGSSYGQTLLHWGKDSEGFDVSDRFVQFMQSLGKEVHRGNVEDGFPMLQPESYDAIFTNNLLEHLVSPHLFLVRLFSLLKPGGVLAIGHPVVPPQPFRFLRKAIGFQGWLAAEHINFFTPQTARLFLQRSGFQIEKQYFSAFASVASLSRLTVPFGVHCLSVCRKIDNYKYSSKRAAEFDPEWANDLSFLR